MTTAYVPLIENLGEATETYKLTAFFGFLFISVFLILFVSLAFPPYSPFAEVKKPVNRIITVAALICFATAVILFVKAGKLSRDVMYEQKHNPYYTYYLDGQIVDKDTISLKQYSAVYDDVNKKVFLTHFN